MQLIVLLSILSASHIDMFDGKPIYENPIAWVRSPEIGISIRRSEYRKINLTYFDAAIGRIVPIIRLHQRNVYNNLDFQVALEGGTWVLLGYDNGMFPLITQDFYFSIPLMFKINDLSGVLKWNHISSHRSEGFDILWKKVLTPEERYKIERTERQENISISLPTKNYSRDFVSLDLAYEFYVDGDTIKPYIQGGYIYKIFPRYLKRWFYGGGFEIKSQKGLFSATDIRYNQDTNTTDFAMQIGWELQNHSSKPRFCLNYYNGSDRRGQFLGRYQKEVGIGIYVR